MSLSKKSVQLQADLQAHVRDLMGDTPINLNSPEQLSWVIYSRKVLDKQYWGNAIDPYMDDAEFRSLLNGTDVCIRLKQSSVRPAMALDR